MKNIFKLLMVLLTLFVTLSAENIDECKTDIYFGNGVWNSAKDTEKSIIQLQKVIDKEIIKNDPKLKAKYGQIKLQYNWSQGNMLDVLETYYQLREAGQVRDYQFFAVIYALSGANSTLTLSAAASQKLMASFTRNWEQGNVDEMWQKYYDESFKLSHKVLLISHSQGNLFANRIYDTINPTEYKAYFANLQVASPASEVKAEKGDYVTLSTDLTSADPVINFIPGSMSPNVSGNSGHELVNAYLLQADPLSKIITKIQQLLVSLDAEPSQWKTQSEQNKSTKEYRITVKHRFDTSIINIANVYPFAPSKKLYYIQGEFSENISGYVKASCGGTEISASWTGKEDNEFYMINNPEKEKITGVSGGVVGENLCVVRDTVSATASFGGYFVTLTVINLLSDVPIYATQAGVSNTRVVVVKSDEGVASVGTDGPDLTNGDGGDAYVVMPDPQCVNVYRTSYNSCLESGVYCLSGASPSDHHRQITFDYATKEVTMIAW